MDLKLPSMPKLRLNFSLKEKLDKIKSSQAALSPEDKKKNLISTVAIILMCALSVYTCYNFKNLLNLSTDTLDTVMAPPQENKEIKERGLALNAKYDAAIALKDRTPELVTLADAIGRSPVSQVTPPPTPEVGSTSGDLPAAADFVPSVAVKALIVLGGSSVCTLDIEGEQSGQVFKPGSAFGGGKGKVLSIDSKGVSWTWKNKRHRSDI